MNVDADELDMGPVGGATVERRRLGERDAELAFLQAGRDVGMRPRVDIRVDAKAHRRAFARFRRDSIEALELARRLDIEAANAEFERLTQLGFALPYPRKHHLCGIAAGGRDARQLSSRHHVEAAAQPRENVENREVGIGFQRITRQVIEPGECTIELAIGALERRARIDEARRAVLRCDLGQGQALDRERAVALDEERHRVSSLVGGASDPGVVSGALGGNVVGGTAPGGRPVGSGAVLPGGSLKGPLMPQPAMMKATAQMMMTIERGNIGMLYTTSAIDFGEV